MPDRSTAVVEPRSRLDDVLAWIKDHEKFVLLTAVAFQTLFLVVMIVLHLMPLLIGKTILVRVTPVDPRSLFQGDYVVLSYEFSQVPETIEGLPGSYWQQGHEWTGRTVYVTLVPEPDGRHWRAQKFSIYRPPDGTYLQGRIVSTRRIVFGIESFYVPEGRGFEYERAMLDRRLSAEIAVTADGRAALRSLQIE